MKPYITTKLLDLAVEDMAGRIRLMYQDCAVMGIFFGATPLLRDLRAKLSRCEQCCAVTIVGGVQASSYGDAYQSSGVVDVTYLPPDRLFRGKVVLLLDDVIETGKTMWVVRERLLEKGAASVVGGALISKMVPDALPSFVDADLIQFYAPRNHFLIGYGMDHRGKYRDLPYIVTKEQLPDLWRTGDVDFPQKEGTS